MILIPIFFIYLIGHFADYQCQADQWHWKGCLWDWGYRAPKWGWLDFIPHDGWHICQVIRNWCAILASCLITYIYHDNLLLIPVLIIGLYAIARGIGFSLMFKVLNNRWN